VSLTVSNSTGSNTKTKSQYIKILGIGGGENVPLTEGFENTSFPAHPSDATKNWAIDGTSSLKWERSTAAASSGSASIRLRNLLIASGAVNTFTSPNIDMGNIEIPINLTFKVAYAQKNSESSDRLRVLISKNCGYTWQPRYSRIGAALATNGGAYVTSNFTPTATQWKEETVSISTLANCANTYIQFEFTSGGGNHIYIDNINITGTVGFDELKVPVADFQIFPNPISYDSYISFFLNESKNCELAVYDFIGRSIYTTNLGLLAQGAHDFVLYETIPELKSGVYIIELNMEGIRASRKVIVMD